MFLLFDCTCRDDATDLFGLVAGGHLTPAEAQAVLATRKRSRVHTLDSDDEQPRKNSAVATASTSGIPAKQPLAKPDSSTTSTPPPPAHSVSHPRTSQPTLFKHFTIKVQRGDTVLEMKAVDVPLASSSSSASKSKTVTCPFCNYEFGNAGALKQHVLHLHPQSFADQTRLQGKWRLPWLCSNAVLFSWLQ